MDTNRKFWDRVYKTPSCWFWIGGMNKGYGALRPLSNVQNIPAHVFSYQLHKGQVPPGAKVLHSCDTPQCVNPDHLFIGDARKNTNDSVAKGTCYLETQQYFRTTCRNGHKIEEAGFYFTGTRRTCKACKRIVNRNYKKRRKDAQ